MKSVKRFMASFVSFVGLAVLLSACSSSQPPRAYDLSGDPATLVPQYLTVKKAEKLKGIKKVVIPQFMVQFVTRSGGGAATTTTEGHNKAIHVTYTLKNIEQAQFQAIADRLYDQFVEQLKAAGIEVVPLEVYEKGKPYQRILKAAKTQPFEVNEMNSTSVYFGAKGLPVYFAMDDKRQGLGNMMAAQFTNFRAESWEEDIADDNNCAIMTVNYGVMFASMEAKGGYAVSSPSVKTDLRVALIPADTKYRIYSKNGTTRFILKEPVYAEGPFLTDVTDMVSTAGKIANFVSGSTTKKYDATADAAAYASLVEKHIAAINGLVFSQMKANF